MVEVLSIAKPKEAKSNPPQCVSSISPANSSIVFGPVYPIPPVSIHSAFSQHAIAHPEAIAVKHLTLSLTYRELDYFSDKLAIHLRDMNVTRGRRVLLLVSRSIAMVVGILATLKAGAAYIPLDGGIVATEALSTILEDAEPVIVLCLSKFTRRVQDRNIRAIDIELFMEHATGLSAEKIQDKTLPSDEAYVIYTSGTTGRPKGVSVSHGNVTNLILCYPGNLSICPGKRVSQILNVSFDMCAYEVLGCLTNGGTLVFRPSGVSCDDWMTVLREVDVIIATPSILTQLDPGKLENAKVVVTAGEWCPQRLADEWAVGRVFWNCCGPTETTIINTAHLHTSGFSNTIGKPTPNNSVYVLDGQLSPVPVGVVGTIWAGGAGVCRGYVNLPELNSKKFRPDPFHPAGGIMYNTGDIGCLRADGELDHFGREDDQVKIKGFRIELDGIAAAISNCPGVCRSSALLVHDQLWGFYAPCCVPELDVQLSVERILPYYARPVAYLSVPSIPLTKNGKIDKLALRRLAEGLIQMEQGQNAG